MAPQAVRALGDPCLRKVAEPVPESMFGSAELNRVVEDLVDSMKAANGAGIAGPQIAEDWRVFVAHGTGDNPRYPYKPKIPLTVFVNPELEVLDDTAMHLYEGCLSVPGFRGLVQRACRVRCTARRPDGTKFSVVAEGHAAGTLQHENDHLNGVLFPDRAKSSDLMTSAAFDEHYKADFFRYAMGLNRIYSNPLVFEDEAVVEPSEKRRKLGGGAAVYEAELTWTGSSFEKGIRIVVDETGVIVKVGRGEDVPAATTKLEGHALIPGFVNAHSHAFQRGLRGLGESYPKGKDGEAVPSFWTWREAMYSLVSSLDVEAFRKLTRQCFEEMASAGITTVGEFHYFHHASTDDPEDFVLDEVVMEAARAANVRPVLLNAYYEYGGFGDQPLGAAQQRFRTKALDRYWAQMDKLASRLDAKRGEGLGVVAHSLRAVGKPSLKALAEESAKRKMVFHLHLEEQPKEIEDCKAVHGTTPLALLMDTVKIDERYTAVHCTHSLPEELTSFSSAGGNVCICPLTEGSLGDGIFKPLESTHGSVCLGSDCNARIDMLEEMRWLEYTQRLKKGQRGAFSAASSDPELAGVLLKCATVHGAHALGVNTGTIEAGKWADFALLDLKGAALVGATPDNLLGAAIFGGAGEGLVVDTCVAGRWTKCASRGTRAG